MKKLLILICLFVQFWLPVLAEYKPIPKALSKQYKAEIERTIKNEFNIRYNNIKNYDKQVLAEEIENRYTLIDMGLQSEMFYFFIPLINITEKYTNIKDDIPTTDFWPNLHEILIPYFKDNDIDTRLVDKLISYSEKKEQSLRKKFLTINDYLKDFVYSDSNFIYNYRSIKYNKLRNIYSMDIAIDITEIDPAYEYKYPYKDGYIKYLIFKTKLHNKNFSIKYKGFVAFKQSNTNSNNIIAVQMKTPKILGDIKQIEKNIYKQININSYKTIFKNLVNN